MRHELPFPIHNDCGICNYLRSIWKCGWLDEYSDDHFLIKAIENRLTAFIGFTQMLNNEPNLHRLIKGHGIIDNDSFNINFYMNLSGCLACLQTMFGNDHMERCSMDGFTAFGATTSMNSMTRSASYIFYIMMRGNKSCIYLLKNRYNDFLGKENTKDEQLYFGSFAAI